MTDDNTLPLTAGTILGPKVPGYNVDRIDVDAGLRMLNTMSYTAKTWMVIQYALLCWARGEEARAEKNAIDRTFYGVSLTEWYMILAAARAGGEANALHD